MLFPILHKLLVSGELVEMIQSPETEWHGLDVTYEDPHVQRIWTNVGRNRVNLHKIFPCEKPYFHAHDRPSAILILKGYYEMALATAPWGQSPAPEPAHRVVIGPGSYYETLTPDEWHSVSPIGSPSYSIMLSGPPFEGLQKEKGAGRNDPLSEGALLDLKADFEDLLKPVDLSNLGWLPWLSD